MTLNYEPAGFTSSQMESSNLKEKSVNKENQSEVMAWLSTQSITYLLLNLRINFSTQTYIYTWHKYGKSY